MFYLCVVDVHLCPSVGVGRHTAALSYIAVGCFDGIWDGVGRIRCVGVSPCAHDCQPVQPRTNLTLCFRRRVPFQPQPDVCGYGLLAGCMGGLFGAPAAVVVFGCICCLYDTLSNHARRTRFGAEIRRRIRVLLSARSPLVIRRGSFQSSITRLLLYGMNVNTRCFQTTPLDGYTKLLTLT